ncbi:Homeodomain-only protein [Lamellibrachia satsuma]|nr:Homeodomain-only protein [Lamellibrachia satsuma]
MIDARLFPPDGLPRVKRDQHRKLEERFRECRNPTGVDIALIAAEVGLTEQQTTVWFRHRLAMWRKQQGLPANFGFVTD